MPTRSSTTEEDAALIESVVVPRYTSHFTRLILGALEPGMSGTVLDVGCGTGHPTFELLEHLGETGRVIAIDRDDALVDLARRRALEQVGTRVFFKVENAETLSFADEVFDAVVGNMTIAVTDDPASMLSELYRVLAPGGQLLLTRALEGTYEEVLDMFREVALRHDLVSMQSRIDEVAGRYPPPSAFAAQVRAAGFESVGVTGEGFRLPFRNAAQLFTDDLVRVTCLPEWRWIAGFEPGGAERFEEAERCLNIYFGGGPLSLRVEAGLVIGTRPHTAAEDGSEPAGQPPTA